MGDGLPPVPAVATVGLVRRLERLEQRRLDTLLAPYAAELRTPEDRRILEDFMM